MVQVAVIIVTYNSAGVVLDALQSVVGNPHVAECIVIDNASADTTCADIAARFPNVVVVKSEKNLGFGQANNKVLNTINTEFALLLNPDAVMQPDAIAALLSAAEMYPNAALISPQLYNAEGIAQECSKKNVFNRERTKGTFYKPEGPMCAEFLSGAVWMVRMSALHKVGMFDPALFLFYEDDDLCMRMRNAGYELVLIPEAKAMHLQGKSTTQSIMREARKQFHLAHSRIYLEYKYRGYLRALWLRTFFISKYFSKFIFNIIGLQTYRARRSLHAALGAAWPLRKTS